MNPWIEVLLYAGAIVTTLTLVLVIDKVIEMSARRRHDEIEDIFRRDRALDVLREWPEDQ